MCRERGAFFPGSAAEVARGRAVQDLNILINCDYAAV